ncbi:MAG TPA: hypothetical protein VFY56_08840 [Propionibacteriaceae bacterium]|nr:hypothetical protein [Propionibacteriaceae bacterium]
MSTTPLRRPNFASVQELGTGCTRGEVHVTVRKRAGRAELRAARSGYWGTFILMQSRGRMIT